jgi:hypothetical protein
VRRCAQGGSRASGGTPNTSVDKFGIHLIEAGLRFACRIMRWLQLSSSGVPRTHSPQAQEQVDGWMVGTSPNMTNFLDGRVELRRQFIPAAPTRETLLPPRLTRGRCRRALRCETRAARRWRPRSDRARPGKERSGRTPALPATVPRKPVLAVQGTDAALDYHREPGLRALLPSPFISPARRVRAV